MTSRVVSLFLALCLSGCSCEKARLSAPTAKPSPLKFEAGPNADAEAAIARPTNKVPILIRGARILTANKKIFESGHILFENGIIKTVGDGPGDAPEGTEIIDATGKVITPGLIDAHSHIGVYPNPQVSAHDDGNEMVKPVTAEVWAEHGFWPQDPSIWRAVAGGITTIQVLPGSANLIGGRSFTAKLAPEVSAAAMKFQDAPQGLKMACGENPKRIYKDKGGPFTRMGNVAGYRAAFQKAFEYNRALKKYHRDLRFWKQRTADAKKDEAALTEIGDPPEPPARDLTSETLADVLNGKILVQNHCYRADEMSLMIDLAHEFGFKIRAFHHGLEAYKIRHRLAKEGIATATWADWWGFKMEAFDGIPYNIALLEQAGARPVMHSDSEHDIRHLNQEIAKAMLAGQKLGINVSEDQALSWLTSNAAWALGIEDKAGSLEEGKHADLVVWDQHPFSVYAKADVVFIDGLKVFDRRGGSFPLNDFELGLRSSAIADGSEPAVERKDTPFPTKLDQLVTKFDQERKPLEGTSFVIEKVRLETGDGTVQEDAYVVVRGGKIEKVAKELPGGTEGLPRIDGVGKTLTPGFIESRTQLGMFEVEMEEKSSDAKFENQDGEVTPGLMAVDGFNPASVRFGIEREEGVTSAVTSPQGHLFFGTAAFFDLSLKPEITDKNRQIAMFGGIGEEASEAFGKSRSGTWLKLREISEDVRYYRRNRAAVDRGEARELALSPLHLRALIPVFEGKMPWVVEAHRESDIRALLRFKDDVSRQGDKLSLVIVGGSEAWMVAEGLAKAKTPVILFPSFQMPVSFQSVGVRDDSAALLAKAGVKVAFSTSQNNVRRLRQEAGIAVSYGFNRQQAMRAITLTPAEIFGRDKEVGSVTASKRANLVLWSGDPLQPLSIAERVWIDGKEQPALNRQRQLADRYQKK
jgi:imidazolonepropionase-like amidohydrolase